MQSSYQIGKDRMRFSQLELVRPSMVAAAIYRARIDENLREYGRSSGSMRGQRRRTLLEWSVFSFKAFSSSHEHARF